MTRATSIQGVLWLTLLAAACGARTELEVPPPLPPPPPEPFCGDGEVDPGEACDLGDDNRQIPAIELIHQGEVRAVMPFDTATDAVAFYDYRSESSHTGFEEVDLGVLVLHRDLNTGILGLGAHYGIDEDESGITLEHGLVDMDIEGVPGAVRVVVEDEPEQEEVIAEPGAVLGRWEFWRNSDGLMLEGLPFPGDWELTVTVDYFDGITRWRFVDENGEAIALDPSREAILRAYLEPSACRPDCTIPRCGDGIVDGGEVCDDGNTEGGDGCAPDCTNLFD